MREQEKFATPCRKVGKGGEWLLLQKKIFCRLSGRSLGRAGNSPLYNPSKIKQKIKKKEKPNQKGVPSVDTGGFLLCKTVLFRSFWIWVSGLNMAFFTSAINILQTLVVAIGAGLAVWGVINLLEGYGNDNPGANAHVR